MNARADAIGRDFHDRLIIFRAITPVITALELHYIERLAAAAAQGAMPQQRLEYALSPGRVKVSARRRSRAHDLLYLHIATFTATLYIGTMRGYF